MKLLSKQQAVMDHVVYLLTNKDSYNGVILRGDEGCGKTIMALAIINWMKKKTLYVCDASAIEDTVEKLQLYKKSGFEVNMDITSYHMFRREAFDTSKYEFFIFDECHNLRNWGADWTKKFSRVCRTKPFVAMSATPAINSPLDYIYMLLRSGAFGRMPATMYKKIFFGAEKSYFGDFVELKSFRNEDRFYTHAERVIVDIKAEDVDPEIGQAKIDIEYIEGDDYGEAKQFKDLVKVQTKAGLRKVTKHIKYIEKHINGRTLIYCKFHKTAKELKKHLYATGYEIKMALDKDSVAAAFKWMKAGDDNKVLITTLGLTRSGLDLNECNNVIMVESTYAWLTDRQSIYRTRRIEKRGNIKVTYIAYRNERPLVICFQKYSMQFSHKRPRNSSFGPSQLDVLEGCPGGYWLKHTGSSVQFPGQAIIGQHVHKALERYCENTALPIPGMLKDECADMIEECRQYINDPDWICYNELRMEDKSIRHDFRGTADFVAINHKLKKVIIADYKNGIKNVTINDNLQLSGYLILLQSKIKDIDETYDIRIVIWQRRNKKTKKIDFKKIEVDKTRIRSISSNIDAAEADPENHISINCTNPFCPAYDVHRKLGHG